jgi:hypothetical protein
MTATSSVAVLPVAAFPGAAASSSVTVAVTGVNATGAVGTATGIGLTNAIATGVYATGVINAVSASGGGQTQTAQGFLLGFGPVASSPIGGYLGAGAGALVTPTGVFATGVVGTARVDTVLYPSGVFATGAIGTATASGNIIILATGVAGYGVVSSVAVVIGNNTVAVFGTPIYALLGRVTVLNTSGSGILVSGVYATGRVGNVYVRQYTPVSWIGINTAQSPSWTAVIT